MSSRTSPLGANKTVAFSRLPGEGPAASSLTRTGPGCGHNAGPVGQHQSTLRAGPRLRAEGLMVPPASDAATLRRQVAALQMDLDAHIDGEQRLQSINQQLRERFPSSPLQHRSSPSLHLQFSVDNEAYSFWLMKNMSYEIRALNNTLQWTLLVVSICT